MKLFLSAAILAIASAQINPPVRLRSQKLALLAEKLATVHASDMKVWDAEEEFGRRDEITAVRMLLADMSMSMSESMSMSMSESMSMSMSGSMSMPVSMSMSMSLSMSMSTGVPTRAPFVASTDVPTSDGPSSSPSTKTETPTTETPAPSPSTYSTQAPTMSKSRKVKTQELFTYSWSIPPEYNGYFEIFEGHGHGPKGMHTNLKLIDVVELGTGTTGSNSVFLPRDEYTINVVNQNKTVGFCCNGTQPGWIYFTWGGLEFDKVTGMYQEKKNSGKFVAEFHKNPGKVDMSDDGAYYELKVRL